MNTRIPAETFPVGEFITEEMTERGWTRQGLAMIAGMEIEEVEQIINGGASLSIEQAHKLAAAFGTSADIWLRLGDAAQTAPAGAGEAI